MKILFLADFPMDDIGGAQKSVLTCIKAICSYHECYILCPGLRNGDFNDERKVKFIYFTKGKGRVCEFISKLVALRRTVKVVKPDFIHAQFSQYGFLLMIYNAYMNSEKIRCIFTDRDYFDAYNKRYKAVFSKLANKMYSIVCTTELNAKRWEEETTCSKIYVIPNSLDVSWKCYDEEYEKGIRISRVDNRFCIGFVGRFVKFKRWDIALSIAKALNVDDFRFIFVLEPAHHDKECSRYIGNLKKEINNVDIFISASSDELSDLYYQMDVFVLTSDNESFGRTLLEAMSRRTAVIGTDSGGVPEVIGRKDLLFPTGGADGAIKLIHRLKDDVGFCEECKNYGLKRVVGNFSLEEQQKKFLKLYEE